MSVAHVDVVGLDVAVQVARAVHHLEPVEERGQQRDDARLGDVLVLLAVGLERLAALVLEDHVGGLVGLEEARHAHDVRVAEGGEGARLDEEAVEAVLVELLVGVVARLHAVVERAVGELLGKVFLDDHLGGEVHVGGGIGDAEAALAEDAVDAVLEKAEARGQREARRGGLGLEDAARVVGRPAGGGPGGDRRGIEDRVFLPLGMQVEHGRRRALPVRRIELVAGDRPRLRNVVHSPSPKRPDPLARTPITYHEWSARGPVKSPQRQTLNVNT